MGRTHRTEAVVYNRMSLERGRLIQRVQRDLAHWRYIEREYQRRLDHPERYHPSQLEGVTPYQVQHAQARLVALRAELADLLSEAGSSLQRASETERLARLGAGGAYYDFAYQIAGTHSDPAFSAGINREATRYAHGDLSMPIMTRPGQNGRPPEAERRARLARDYVSLWWWLTEGPGQVAPKAEQAVARERLRRLPAHFETSAGGPHVVIETLAERDARLEAADAEERRRALEE